MSKKIKKQKLQTRSKQQPQDLTSRDLTLRFDSAGMPASLSEQDRTVDLVMATEQPVRVLDWERWELVDEILLMSGARFARQVPLLDTHDRSSSHKVLGSVRNIKSEDDQLVGTAKFSTVRSADDLFTKIKEGHLTDFSVGYRVNESVWVEDGTTAEINGRQFTGPLRVVTDWTVKELSCCPIGADELAKARAEAVNHKPERSEEEMNERLRKMLEKLGLRTDATDEQALEFLEQLHNERQEGKGQVAEPVAEMDEARMRQIAEEAVRSENDRVSDILALGRKFHMDEEARAAVADRKVTVADFTKQVLDKHAERSQQPTPSFRVEVGPTDSEKFRAAARDAVILRAGLTVESPADGADQLQGYMLRELARECLRRAGERPSANVMEMVGRALTTSDFPYILADSANKALLTGYEQAEETWEDWCGVGNVTDFKLHSMVRASETDDLDELKELEEYKYGNMSENKEQYQVATYGKLFAISRQAIINDDLGALTDIPTKHGEAAARKVGDIAYAVLTANAAMGDGTALFHADHGNLPSGAALSVTSLGSAVTAMKTQKDIKGLRNLNLRPRFFIAPVALEASAEQFFNTSQIGGATNQPNLANPYAGSVFVRIYDPRLDDDDANAWYLATMKGKTVTVFFLNGVRTPYMETKNGWSVDGVEYKVRMDAGAKAVDWRGLIKNAGPS